MKAIIANVLNVVVVFLIGATALFASLPTTDQFVDQGTDQFVEVTDFQPVDAKTGCTENKTKDFHDQILVVTLSGDRIIMDFDVAHERNSNSLKGDNVWVVGFC